MTAIKLSEPTMLIVEPDEDYTITLKLYVSTHSVYSYINFNSEIPSYDKDSEFVQRIVRNITLDPTI